MLRRYLGRTEKGIAACRTAILFGESLDWAEAQKWGTHSRGGW
jgi:hypothetical protein